ncbi:hypothetical protein DFH09DRAFT_1114585 [Mycena vulgaris]|nr:hypothetical protein DFH09DRAFT_1114585 [Mycena vulgaris]
MSLSTTELPYEAGDVTVLKPALIVLVQHQVEKWPGGHFQPKAETAVQICEVLMEAQYGFTKEILVMEALESPLSDSVSSEHKFDSQWVKLLMEDYCDSPKPFKISQQVLLYVIDTLHLIWDPDHPNNRVYFVKVTDDALLDEVQSAPQFAMIPGTDILEIFVGHVEDTYFHVNPTCFLDQSQPEGDVNSHGAFDVTDPSAKHLGHAQLRAVGNAARKQLGETNGDVQIRRAPGAAEKGPAEYRCCCVIEFGGRGFGDILRTGILRMNIQVDETRGIGAKKNQKQSIQQALGVGSTSVAEAENFVCILKRYGEGGSRLVQVVMDQIS